MRNPNPRPHDQWGIEELVARYTMEPEIRDVFVEGEFDRKVVTQLLKLAGCEEAVVYEINAVNVPAPVLERHHIPPTGNKARVVALACELEATIGNGLQVTCIADKDYDDLLGHHFNAPALLFTDHSCLEGYLLTSGVLSKFLLMVVRNCPLNADELLEMLKPEVETLFAVRAVLRRLGLEVGFVRLKKSCRISRNSITVQVEEVVEKTLSKANAKGIFDGFMREVSEVRSAMGAWGYSFFHKEDLFGLLQIYIAQFDKDKCFPNPGSIERSLGGCIDFQRLLNEPLFRSLINRIRS